MVSQNASWGQPRGLMDGTAVPAREPASQRYFRPVWTTAPPRGCRDRGAHIVGGIRSRTKTYCFSIPVHNIWPTNTYIFISGMLAPPERWGSWVPQESCPSLEQQPGVMVGPGAAGARGPGEFPD